MDNNPTFAGRELIRSLSASSLSSSKNSGERPLLGNRSFPTGIQGALGITDQEAEAYHRLGRRLSVQAHGGSINDAHASTKRPAQVFIRPSAHTAFQFFKIMQHENQTREAHQQQQEEERLQQGKTAATDIARQHRLSPHDRTEARYRTSKVRKTGLTDHGEHHPALVGTSNILRKITCEGRESFLQFQTKQQQQADPDPQISPHRYAFAQLALDGNTSRDQNSSPMMIDEQDIAQHLSGRPGPPVVNNGSGKNNNNKGLLSAVLEVHSESTTRDTVSQQRQEETDHRSSPTASISTKDSKSINNLSVNSPVSRTSTLRGQCLTLPSEAVANNGLDNEEGNLIVYENDRIRIPRKNVHTIDSFEHWNKGSAEFRVLGMLGQGTFAQVFKCMHLQTGNIVAVKIVKNKPAYTRQATVEIDVFRALKESARCPKRDFMVNLLCYFMYESHLCLVFEMLGQNLYEILKRRQFRGLPLTAVQDIVRQVLGGIRDISSTNIIHCDLKPENVLLESKEACDRLVALGEGRLASQRQNAPTKGSSTTGEISTTTDSSPEDSSTTETVKNGPAKEDKNPQAACSGKIKLIDFGSACFDGYTAHTYIQSRFYRSPEVLIGIPYDSVIDLWSLGCVAAEMFLGLPILPGVHEHDQLQRIGEMISPIPDWMLDQGSKTTKYFLKYMPRPTESSVGVNNGAAASSPSAPPLPQWRLKTQQEYIKSLSQGEIRKKGGLEKLEKQPGNRYFKRTNLADILFLHGQTMMRGEEELVPAFVHFVYGLLDPDPWKRWTAFQSMQHPFITGDLGNLRPRQPGSKVLDPREQNHANLELSWYWEPPWDPAICRRKLLNVQKLREKQQNMRKNNSSGKSSSSQSQQDSFGQVINKGVHSHQAENHMQPAPRKADPFGVSVGESPPPQIMSTASISTNTTTPSSRRSIESGAFFAGYARSAQTETVFASSSSGAGIFQPRYHGDVPIRGQLATPYQNMSGRLPTPSSFSGAQSFSGIDPTVSHFPHALDFVHALNRPGVVPRHDLGPTSHAGSSSGSSQTPTSLFGVGASSPGFNTQAVPSSIADAHFAHQSMIAPGHHTDMFPAAGFHGMPAGGSHHSSVRFSSTNSVISNATMPEMVDLQNQTATGQMQQQYNLPHQQHYFQRDFPQYGINQPQQMQHHQQQQISVYHQNLYMPQEQHSFNGQPGLSPHHAPEQLFLATDASGRQYYISSSATGQPIVLQPVVYMNQPTANQVNIPADSAGMGAPTLQHDQPQWQARQQNSVRRGSHHHQSQYQRRYARKGTSM